jgi:hypothetical protein
MSSLGRSEAGKGKFEPFDVFGDRRSDLLKDDHGAAASGWASAGRAVAGQRPCFHDALPKRQTRHVVAVGASRYPSTHAGDIPGMRPCADTRGPSCWRRPVPRWGVSPTMSSTELRTSSQNLIAHHDPGWPSVTFMRDVVLS